MTLTYEQVVGLHENADRIKAQRIDEMATALRIASGAAGYPNSWFQWIASDPRQAAEMQSLQTAALLSNG